MKKKVVKATLTVVAIATAFLVGRTSAPTTETPETETSCIQLDKAIPIDDIACWYLNGDGYISVELKDVTHQLDEWGNASYEEVLKDVPNETETYINNMLDMSKVVDYTATENGLQIFLADGSGYYWER